MMKKNWRIFSSNRQAVFGISIILIILFHYFENVIDNGKTGLIPSAARLCNNVVLGSVGVEFFLLLSGIGIMHSLTKNQDVNAFYGRRFSRVVLPYLIWGSLYWAVVDLIALKLGVADFLKDLFFINLFLKGVSRMWFIFLITVLYFLSPFLIDVLYYDGKHSFAKLMILLAVIMIPTAVLSFRNPELYKNIEIALTRIPCYIVGLYIGRKVYKEEEIKHPFVILAGLIPHLALVVLRKIPSFPYHSFLENTFPLNRWLMVWYGLALLFLLVMILDKIRLPRLKGFLAVVGKYCLELYLTHVCIRHIFNSILNLKTARVRYYVICLAISVVCSILLKRTMEGIIGNREKEA